MMVVLLTLSARMCLSSGKILWSQMFSIVSLLHIYRLYFIYTKRFFFSLSLAQRIHHSPIFGHSSLSILLRLYCNTIYVFCCSFIMHYRILISLWIRVVISLSPCSIASVSNAHSRFCHSPVSISGKCALILPRQKHNMKDLPKLINLTFFLFIVNHK